MSITATHLYTDSTFAASLCSASHSKMILLEIEPVTTTWQVTLEKQLNS